MSSQWILAGILILGGAQSLLLRELGRIALDLYGPDFVVDGEAPIAQPSSKGGGNRR